MSTKRRRPRLKTQLNVLEFAEATGAHRITVGRWLANGVIKGKRQGREWLIPRSEVAKVQRTQARARDAVFSNANLFSFYSLVFLRVFNRAKASAREFAKVVADGPLSDQAEDHRAFAELSDALMKVLAIAKLGTRLQSAGASHLTDVDWIDAARSGKRTPHVSVPKRKKFDKDFILRLSQLDREGAIAAMKEFSSLVDSTTTGDEAQRVLNAAIASLVIETAQSRGKG